MNQQRAPQALSALLVAMLCIGCATTTPATNDKPGGRAKTAAKSAAQRARVPSALRRSHLAALLHRLSGDSRSVGFIAADLTRPLYLWDGLRLAAAATSRGSAVLRQLEQLLQRAGARDLSGAALRAMFAKWGVAVDKPAGLVVVGRRRLLLLGVRDEAQFRKRVAGQVGKVMQASWSEQRVAGRSVWRFGSAREAIAECLFGRHQLTACSSPSLAAFSGFVAGRAPRRSLWSRLGSKTRAHVSAGAPHVVTWALSHRIDVSATVDVKDDAVALSVDVAGGGIGTLLKVAGQWPSGALYARYRALKGERFYLRLPQMLLARVLRTPFTRGWPSGEILLIGAPKCALPSILVGSQRPQVVKALLSTLGQRMRKITISQRSVAGRSVVELSDLGRLGGGLLPKSIGLAATSAGLLVAPWPCMAHGLRWATQKVTSSPTNPPVAAGNIALGDPLQGLWALLNKRVGGSLPPQMSQIFDVVRVLASQLHDAKGSVSLMQDGLHAELAVRLRHRGSKDDAARALWHRAVAARTLGQRATYRQIARQIAKKFPDTRYAQAAKQRPVMLALFGGVFAAVAIPAFVKYIRKSKTVEATEGLDKLRAGARAFYQVDHYDSSAHLLPRHFPKGKVGWTPKLACCKQPGRKCAPSAKAWNQPIWLALHFQLVDHHYFQYRYRSSGSGKKAKFVIEARADLDCDGVFSSYKMLGRIKADGGVRVVGPIISNELE